MDRILRAAGGTLTLFNYDETTGTLANAGAGNGTADNFDSAGVAVSTGLVATNIATGTYQISIPSTYTALDTFDVTWNMPNGTKRYTQFEVVGAFLFTVAGLKAFDSDLTSQTAAACVAARTLVEDAFHDTAITIGAFRPQGRRDHLSGDGTDHLLLERVGINTLVVVKIDGVALSSGDLAALKLDRLLGELTRPSGTPWPVGVENVEVFYEYGDRAVDQEVARAAMILARYSLTRSGFDANDRATAIFTDVGGYRLTIAGRDGHFGLPEVDAVLARKGHLVPGVA